MIVIAAASYLFLFFYAAYLLYGACGFIKINNFNRDTNSNKTKTCIVICARNEETTILPCLKSIHEQEFDFTLLEIILVNDASSDKTLELAISFLENTSLNYTIINHSEKEGKKKSITEAVNVCNSELIVTRDADTYTQSKYWLKTLVSFYEQTKKEFIIAPVEVQNAQGILAQLQVLENDALSVISGGYAFFKKAFLCSGANLAFTKTLFNRVNGYQSHLHIPSGDDVLFLEEVKKAAPDAVAWLKQKEASVFTYPQQELNSLLTQKIRWASKFLVNPNKTNFRLSLILFFVHFFTIFYLFLAWFIPHLGLFGLFFILCRLFIDFLLLFLASRYFNKGFNLPWFLALSLVYSIYVIINGLAALFIKPKWK